MAIRASRMVSTSHASSLVMSPASWTRSASSAPSSSATRWGQRSRSASPVDHPQRVRAPVLAGAFFPRPTNTEVRKFLEEVSTLSDPIDPAFVRDFQKSTLAQPVPPEFFDTVVGEAMKVPARVWRAALQPYLTVVRSRRRGSWSTKVPVTARIGKNQNASPARWRRSSRDSNWRPQFTPM